MKKQLIHKTLAKYYDLIYSAKGKGYEKEVEKVERLISKYKKSDGNKLLDVGCGTGKHLAYLKKGFSCTGIDVNQGILDIAKKNVRGVVFKRADMISFDLGKRFDVIVCLFSSIGYVKTYQNLRKTINNFSKHLKEGGVTIIEPWFTKSVYRVGSCYLDTYESEDVKIARANVSKIKGNVSVMDMHYLIAEKGKGVSHFVDRHELGLFETDRFLKITEKAGLKARYKRDGLEKDRGLYIGVKT